MKLLLEVVAISLVFSTLVYAASEKSENKGNFYLQSFNSIRRAKSCLDILRDGQAESGFYQIFDDADSRITVYCDFTSEPGSAWTLVMSYNFERRFMPQFRIFLTANSPVNEKTANWLVYRMTSDMMTSVASHSTHWRYTCSFPQNGIDYRDYARATFSSLNPLTFDLDGGCRHMEYINVRGMACAQCQAQWWQPKSGKRILHVDSYKNRCQFKVKKGAIKWEDNFGFYDNANPNFRCSASPTSTTNLWFGGYL